MYQGTQRGRANPLLGAGCILWHVEVGGGIHCSLCAQEVRVSRGQQVHYPPGASSVLQSGP